MSILLNAVYILTLITFSPWLIYGALRKNKYREGWGQKLWSSVPVRDGERKCIWLHGVSVGEVNLLGCLIAEVERRWPNVECVISTTTRAGFDLARRKYAPRLVFYCPLDFSWSVRRALCRVRPNLLVLGELELWPNLIATAKSMGVAIAIVNGRLSKRSARGYQWIRPIVAQTLKRLDCIAVQNVEYHERFLALGADPAKTIITGSLKFDGAETNRDNSTTLALRRLWRIDDEDVILLAGSTQAPEEQIVLQSFRWLQERHANLKLILVPRHPERFDEVAGLLDRSHLPWHRRSQLAEGVESPKNARILLVDTVGELRGWWGTATIGFVGGSIGTRGGQSMIEPAAYGVPCCFGPNTRNFREVVEALLARDAARVVETGEDLKRFVLDCLEHPQSAIEMGQRARQLVMEQRGAVDRTMEILRELLELELTHSRAA